MPRSARVARANTCSPPESPCPAPAAAVRPPPARHGDTPIEACRSLPFAHRVQNAAACQIPVQVTARPPAGRRQNGGFVMTADGLAGGNVSRPRAREQSRAFARFPVLPSSAQAACPACRAAVRTAQQSSLYEPTRSRHRIPDTPRAHLAMRASAAATLGCDRPDSATREGARSSERAERSPRGRLPRHAQRAPPGLCRIIASSGSARSPRLPGDTDPAPWPAFSHSGVRRDTAREGGTPTRCFGRERRHHTVFDAASSQRLRRQRNPPRMTRRKARTARARVAPSSAGPGSALNGPSSLSTSVSTRRHKVHSAAGCADARVDYDASSRRSRGQPQPCFFSPPRSGPRSEARQHPFAVSRRPFRRCASARCSRESGSRSRPGQGLCFGHTHPASADAARGAPLRPLPPAHAARTDARSRIVLPFARCAHSRRAAAPLRPGIVAGRARDPPCHAREPRAARSAASASSPLAAAGALPPQCACFLCRTDSRLIASSRQKVAAPPGSQVRHEDVVEQPEMRRTRTRRVFLADRPESDWRPVRGAPCLCRRSRRPVRGARSSAHARGKVP